jgi:hypothetical protein
MNSSNQQQRFGFLILIFFLILIPAYPFGSIKKRDGD